MRAANAGDAIGRPGPTPLHALRAGPHSGILWRWSLAALSPASCALMSRPKPAADDEESKVTSIPYSRQFNRGLPLSFPWTAPPLLRCLNWGRSCDASCSCIACSCSLMPRASLGARAAHRRPCGRQESGLLDLARTLFGAPLVSLAPSGPAAIAGVGGGAENGSLSRAMTLHQRARR